MFSVKIGYDCNVINMSERSERRVGLDEKMVIGGVIAAIVGAGLSIGAIVEFGLLTAGVGVGSKLARERFFDKRLKKAA